jgi:hypothetical protein
MRPAKHKDIKKLAQSHPEGVQAEILSSVTDPTTHAFSAEGYFLKFRINFPWGPYGN